MKSYSPGQVFLASGFRPFFLVAGYFAVVSMAIWTAFIGFNRGLFASPVAAVSWHAHEMVYGYAMAVVAGFLLTAVRNWTGTQTLRGPWLLAAVMAWLLARVAIYIPAYASVWAALILDSAFYLLLLGGIGVPIVKARMWRNGAMVLKVGLLLLSNVAFYLGVTGNWESGIRVGLYSGLYLLLALILTISRRVLPSFIASGVKQPVNLRNSKFLDLSSLVLLLLFWAGELIQPGSTGVLVISFLLFLVHSLRLIGWHTPGIWSNPMLWVLYLSYGFLCVGFLLKSMERLPAISPYMAVHAFAYGGIGLMTLGMMSRVALGHTGRNVSQPPPALKLLFGLLALGAVVRLLAPVLGASSYIQWILVSQFLWIASFTGFVMLYSTTLISSRIDGKIG